MTRGRFSYPKGPRDYFKAGSWNTRCDQCGRKYKANELRREYDGLMVCQDCWDPRHPQELVQPITDPKPPPWTRPDPPPIFDNPSLYVASHSINGMPFNYWSID